MKQLMLKLLIAILITSGCSNAKSDVKSVANSSKSDLAFENKLVNYVKKAINVSKNFTLKDVRIREKKALDQIPGWDIYFLDIDLATKGKDSKVTTVHDKIFANGRFITRDFVDIDKKLSLKDRIVPDMDNSFYRKDHLIYGNFNAKDKIVVFSDPICPFCQGYLPKLLKAVQEHPSKVALFYYHFPLTMLHPEAPTVIKAAIVLQKKGVKDVMQKIYAQKFDIRTKDEKKALDVFNKKMGTNLTLKDINSQDILKKYSDDIEWGGKMMINGTPTVYVNGKKDFSRQKYKEILGIK